MSEQINLFVHGMTLSQAILLALTGLACIKQSPGARLLIPFGLCVSAVIVTPLCIKFNWPTLFHFSMLLESLVPIFFWYLTESIFLDGFRWRLHHGLGIFVFLCSCLLIYFTPTDLTQFHSSSPWILGFHKTLDITALVLAIRTTAKGRKEDLVELRLKLRWLGMLVASALLFGSLALDLYNVETRRLTHPYSLALMSGLLCCLLLCNLILILYKNLLLPPESPVAIPYQEDMERTLDTEGQRLQQAIDQMMKVDKIFKQEGLTLDSLAKMSRCPAYRLRNFINKNLGYRNFNQFLAYYRIKEAECMLKDPNLKNEKILSIAMEVGYSSLAPFNKTFKEIQGMTPSDYRGLHSKTNSTAQK